MATTHLIRVQSVFHPWPCTVFWLRLGRAVDGCKTILGWIFGITMTMMEKLDGAGGGLG